VPRNEGKRNKINKKKNIIILILEMSWTLDRTKAVLGLIQDFCGINLSTIKSHGQSGNAEAGRPVTISTLEMV